MTESTDKQLLDEAPADEQQLDEYLKGDSSVSRQYRQLHGAEVPAQLDRLVLRQAEDAVKRRPLQGRPAWMRWTAPLAVAASAVLVLSIVIETGMRDETVSEVSKPSAPQPTMQAKQRERAESKAEEAVVSEQVVPLVPVQELIAPTYAPDPPPPPVQVDRPAAESRMNSQSPAEPPRAAMQARPSSPPPVAAPAPDVSASGQSVARAADIATRELQSMAVDEAVDEAAAKQSAAVADDVAREAERSTGAAYSRRINAEMPARLKSYSDPEAWLKDIRELRRAGQQEQADREWRRFRAAFPNHEVADTDLAREAER